MVWTPLEPTFTVLYVVNKVRQVVAAAAGVAVPIAAQINANKAAADPTRFKIFPMW